MTITLDDVSCLLQLPITGLQITGLATSFTKTGIRMLLRTMLGLVSNDEADVAPTAGARVRLT